MPNFGLQVAHHAHALSPQGLGVTLRGLSRLHSCVPGGIGSVVGLVHAVCGFCFFPGDFDIFRPFLAPLTARHDPTRAVSHSTSASYVLIVLIVLIVLLGGCNLMRCPSHGAHPVTAGCRRCTMPAPPWTRSSSLPSYTCGNFDIILDDFTPMYQRHATSHAVRCALLGAHAHRVLIGAC